MSKQEDKHAKPGKKIKKGIAGATSRGSTPTADVSKHYIKCQLHSAHMPHSSSWAVVNMNANKRPTQWQQEWWLNSLGKCLPVMHGNLRWRKHMKMPCSCTLFLSATFLYIHYFSRDQTYLTAFTLLPASSLDPFLYFLSILCIHTSFCWWRWAKKPWGRVFFT